MAHEGKGGRLCASLCYGTRTAETASPARSLMRTISVHTVSLRSSLRGVTHADLSRPGIEPRPRQSARRNHLHEVGGDRTSSAGATAPVWAFRRRLRWRSRGSFVAEVLWRQLSLNGHVNGLEAVYEVVDGDRSFTALIRGGSNAAGLGLLDGVILAGWRTGARVQVVFQRHTAVAGMPSCAGAPVNKTCFEGTIHVGRAPRD